VTLHARDRHVLDHLHLAVVVYVTRNIDWYACDDHPWRNASRNVLQRVAFAKSSRPYDWLIAPRGT
jgi:hypothetical protein